MHLGKWLVVAFGCTAAMGVGGLSREPVGSLGGGPWLLCLQAGRQPAEASV